MSSCRQPCGYPERERASSLASSVGRRQIGLRERLGGCQGPELAAAVEHPLEPRVDLPDVVPAPSDLERCDHRWREATALRERPGEAAYTGEVLAQAHCDSRERGDIILARDLTAGARDERVVVTPFELHVALEPHKAATATHRQRIDHVSKPWWEVEVLRALQPLTDAIVVARRRR